MAIIVPGTAQGSIGSEMGNVTDAGSEYARVEGLLTADKLRSRFLFGIPMYSFLPDPVTHRRAEYTPEMQRDAIMRAINWIEMHSRISIQAVQHDRRLPFDRNEYFSLGYFQLPDAPITEVISLAVVPAGQLGAIYVINSQWIENAHMQRGQINIIPFLPATVTGFTPMNVMQGTGTGGAAFLSILGTLGWVAAFWEIVYWAGFKDGRVPLIVNELIGDVAAIQVLSSIGATNRIGNYSVSLDAAQQSVDTGGPNVYDARIKELKEERDANLRKLKKKFGQALFSGNV